jgi:hypothetical protein
VHPRCLGSGGGHGAVVRVPLRLAAVVGAAVAGRLRRRHQQLRLERGRRIRLPAILYGGAIAGRWRYGCWRLLLAPLVELDVLVGAVQVLRRVVVVVQHLLAGALGDADDGVALARQDLVDEGEKTMGALPRHSGGTAHCPFA